MRHPVSTPGFVIPAIPDAAKTGALDSRLRGNDGEVSGFVIPAIPDAAKTGALASRLRGNDGEVPPPGFVIPAKAGTQGFPDAAKTRALDSRRRGNDGESA
jgi:hypothetical protein